ncbi:histone H3 methyltransferase/Trithorax [Volvox carteri f. nagariensis]|uniref:Histone H3 methyltransferase/Trithorax n=1 Tax=Volvox carteri f. nagariensis TaxID=3068 RepID=D8UBR4_VOLCA|nr:histone H3 methyltransferase/Trithorax [Volvox carteri f. nagariensis]EFJ42811.1 histone H3 methyltransferase/Trithorax [Volvox carteri f. nagariensis]|eukprot:XP_002956071.1 histone H3 methyltransferase/Trithorax [Volvox carteri f. nagariensis]
MDHAAMRTAGFKPSTLQMIILQAYTPNLNKPGGDEEMLVLAVEKVQFPSDCLRSMRTSNPGQLDALARHLDSLANELEARAVQHRTARGRATFKEDDRQKLELLRRRAADVRNARDRCEDQERIKGTRLEAAPAAVITPGRLQCAVAVSSAAAMISSAHSPRSATQHQQQLSPSSIPPEASMRRQITAGNKPPAAYAQREDRPQLETSGQGPGAVPYRVCSPASARRRQNLLGQQRGCNRAEGLGPPDHMNTAAVPLGCETKGLPSAHSKQKDTAQLVELVGARRGLDPDHQWNGPSCGRVVAEDRGQAPRNGQGCVDADIGKLYVPRAWPVLPAVSDAAAGSEIREPCMAGPAPAVGRLGKRNVKGVAEAGQAPESIIPVNARGLESAVGGPLRASAVEDQESGVARVGCESVAKGRVSDSDERHRAAVAAAELREAYKHFRGHCSGFKQYHEIQVALWLSPEQLVGREIRVLWPDDGAWFCGRVTSYSADTGMHTVEYDDGDVEHLHLAAEEVRLQVVPGQAERNLAPRPPEELRRVAACLAIGAAQLRARASTQQEHRRGVRQKPPAAHLNRGKDISEPGGVPGSREDEDPQELTSKAERWSAQAAQLQALATRMASEVSSDVPPCDQVSQRQPPARAGGRAEAQAARAAKSEARKVNCARTSADRTEADGEDKAADAMEVDKDDEGTRPTCSGPAASNKAAESAAALPTLTTATNAKGAEIAGVDMEDRLREQEGRDPVPERDDEGGTGLVPESESVSQLPRDWASWQVLRPGEVVWAQFAFVRFFGDHTVLGLPVVQPGARIPDRGGVLPFLAGLELGWHVRGVAGAGAAAGGAGGSHTQRFLRAMFELRTYMTEGELPRGMIPPNYDEDDEGEDDDEEQQQHRAGSASGRGCGDARSTRRLSVARALGGEGRASQHEAAGTTAAAQDITLPLKLGSKLRVLRLGEVVWLSRWFHDEKYIYPLGYTADRLMVSGASGGREVRHVMEVVASADGVRPVFRITPEGRLPVSADTATRAMRALFEEDDRVRGRAFAKTGADLFGLTHQRVAALLRSLPGAERCERFANWPDQDRPPLPPLTHLEEVQRRAMYARALHLPSGVHAIPEVKTGMCFECEVCGEDMESPDNLKFECDLCRCVVHSRCYGVKQPPHGALWLCDVCQLHAAGLPRDRSPPCELCPVASGPMKQTDAGGYVHVLCAVWTPGVTFGDLDSLEPVEGVAKAIQNRASLRCFLCKQQHGACIQCAGDARCYTAFHPMCAREAGLAMCELRQGAGAARGPPQQQQPRNERPVSAAASRGNRTTGSAEVTAAPAAAAAGFCSPAAADHAEQDDGKENLQGSVNAADVSSGGRSKHGGELPTHVLATKLSGGAHPGPASCVAHFCIPPGGQHQDAPSKHFGGGATDSFPPAAPVTDTAAAAAAAGTSLPPRRGRGRPRKTNNPGRAACRASEALGRGRGACLGGISLGNGISLACFCPRHEDLVLHQTAFRCSFAGGRFADRRAELTREQQHARQRQLVQELESNRPAPQPLPTPQQPQKQQPRQRGCDDEVERMGQGGTGFAADGELATGRSMSFADWRSRGHRAPEAVAIAREKRTFVRQLPYLVTGRLQQNVRALEGLHVSCVRIGTGAGGTDSGGSGRVGSCGQVKAGHRSDVGSRVGRDGQDELHGAGNEPTDITALPSDLQQGNYSGQDTAGLLPKPLLEAAAAAGARSVAERYAAMRATVGQRLAAGKSAIHGWGAFAKVPHKRGDMLIEYAGELIRPSVSDVREKRMYNKLVGCGTYIFTLNDDQHIDATRAGNMAHLLNHSCDPNCYSRTITLTDPVTRATSDHVIITAKVCVLWRDIEAWEELTYDYRFNSSEELPCNCGAATCRLLVNWPEQVEDEDAGEDEVVEDGHGIDGPLRGEEGHAVVTVPEGLCRCGGPEGLAASLRTCHAKWRAKCRTSRILSLSVGGVGCVLAVSTAARNLNISFTLARPRDDQKTPSQQATHSRSALLARCEAWTSLIVRGHILRDPLDATVFEVLAEL